MCVIYTSKITEYKKIMVKNSWIKWSIYIIATIALVLTIAVSIVFRCNGVVVAFHDNLNIDI